MIPTQRPTPATITVAPRPRFTVTHNDRAPLTQSVGSALGLRIVNRPVA